jgi:hypothetical protein
MVLRGKIQRILPMQQGTSKAGNQWQKVEFIIEEIDTEYPDILCVSAMNDHVPELLGLNAGDLVEVELKCRVNEYNGRVYNSISLFKIVKAKPQQVVEQQVMPQQGYAPAQQPPTRNETIIAGGDDLPF